jgi:TetR/AcrR family transcriptional regulator, lmrAB and yxaGH operons repressor
MVAAAGRLLRRNGYAATGWRAIVEEAGTPWGSAYHHFPGGKEQLAAEAVELGASEVAAALRIALDPAQPVALGVRRWFDLAARNLRRSDFHDGCPVATVALETAPASAALTAACASALAEWEQHLAVAFQQSGVTRKRAHELATLVLANLEGALLLARVQRTTKPLRLAAEHITAVLEEELGRDPPPS